ncbi:MAG: hypothetical protein LC745_08190, partial [Planctomycetia bacterium]|nr:hypothetical protein [Planctomycetia bacterium]
TLSTDILGPKTTTGSTTDTSLQGRLTNLTLPSRTNFFPMLFFRINSSFLIGRADTQVIHDIVNAVNQFNTSAT